MEEREREMGERERWRAKADRDRKANEAAMGSHVQQLLRSPDKADSSPLDLMFLSPLSKRHTHTRDFRGEKEAESEWPYIDLNSSILTIHLPTESLPPNPLHIILHVWNTYRTTKQMTEPRHMAFTHSRVRRAETIQGDSLSCFFQIPSPHH